MVELWRESLNSDAKDYGGSGMGNMGEVEAAPVPAPRQAFFVAPDVAAAVDFIFTVRPAASEEQGIGARLGEGAICSVATQRSIGERSERE